MDSFYKWYSAGVLGLATAAAAFFGGFEIYKRGIEEGMRTAPETQIQSAYEGTVRWDGGRYLVLKTEKGDTQVLRGASNNFYPVPPHEDAKASAAKNKKK